VGTLDPSLKRELTIAVRRMQSTLSTLRAEVELEDLGSFDYRIRTLYQDITKLRHLGRRATPQKPAPYGDDSQR